MYAAGEGMEGEETACLYATHSYYRHVSLSWIKRTVKYKSTFKTLTVTMHRAKLCPLDR